jgi:hypothetical protein
MKALGNQNNDSAPTSFTEQNPNRFSSELGLYIQT